MDERPILICYDGSAHACRAIHAAADLFATRRAIILNVAPVLTAAESYAVMASAASAADVEQLNTAQALHRASEGVEHARAAGFEAEPRGVLAQPTWEGVVDVAGAVDAAVIVIGSRGLSGVRERFEGSLSHEVAQHSSRPVLIVPPLHEPHS